jgi:hypothetical protein
MNLFLSSLENFIHDSSSQKEIIETKLQNFEKIIKCT